MARKSAHHGDEDDHRQVSLVDSHLSPMLEEMARCWEFRERVEAILLRPARRIARVELEAIIPRDQVGPEEISDVAGMALCRLFERSREYQPGTPVIPWLAEIVRSSAQEFARHDVGAARRPR